jgi:hypothetical protein
VRRNLWHTRKIMAALAAIKLDAVRVPGTAQPLRDAERAGLVVVAPDRVKPLPGRDDVWYLTARQLDSLAVRPMGWEPPRGGPSLAMAGPATGNGPGAHAAMESLA